MKGNITPAGNIRIQYQKDSRLKKGERLEGKKSSAADIFIRVESLVGQSAVLYSILLPGENCREVDCQFTFG